MPPCYSLADLHALAAKADFLLANRRAERNALNLGWGVEQLKAFICGLKPEHHKGVRRNLSILDGRGSIDADKYCARFDEATLSVTRDRRCCEFFMELAIRQLADGQILLIISFHLDSQP